jgi:hypothetical protein
VVTFPGHGQKDPGLSRLSTTNADAQRWRNHLRPDGYPLLQSVAAAQLPDSFVNAVIVRRLCDSFKRGRLGVWQPSRSAVTVGAKTTGTAESALGGHYRLRSRCHMSGWGWWSMCRPRTGATIYRSSPFQVAGRSAEGRTMRNAAREWGNRPDKCSVGLLVGRRRLLVTVTPSHKAHEPTLSRVRSPLRRA